MLRKFNSIQLLVRDVEASVAFYADVIGMQINYEEPHFAILSVDDFRIMLHTDPETLDSREPQEAEDLHRRKCVGATIQFEVEDVDAYYVNLLEQGVTVLTEPTDQPWGWRDLSVTDPDGYRLVFWSVPKRYKGN